MRPYLGSWQRLAGHGVAAVLFGLATLLWPHVTLWALVLLWGAFAFVDGVIALSAAIGDPVLLHRGWVALWGVTGIGAGLVTLAWPAITAVALLVVIAIWSLVVGGSQIAFAVDARHRVSGAWAVGIGGAMLVLLGFVLLVTPADGALAMTWAIGWLAFLFGTVELGLAWSIRDELHHPTDQKASAASHSVS